MWFMNCLWLVGLTIFLGASAGCGGKTGDGPTPGDGGADSTADVGFDAKVDSPFDAPADAATCDAAVAKIASAVTGPFCTTMVSLSVADRSILGWSITCGPHVPTTEADARTTFDTRIPPYTKAADYVLEGPTGGTYDYVFFHSPGDFGGVGVVSFATGTLVFSGSLSWSSLGARIYPKTLRGADELPLVCPRMELPEIIATTGGGAAPDPGVRAPIADVIGRSPIPAMLGRSHAIVHAMLVSYPSDGTESGPGGTSKSEWLVLLDSALLD